MQALWVLNLPHLPSGSVPGCSLSLGTWKRQLRAGKNDNTPVYLAGSKELKELLAARFDPDKHLTGLYLTTKVGTCALSLSQSLFCWREQGIKESERWGFSIGERREVTCQMFDEGGPHLGIGGWQA